MSNQSVELIAAFSKYISELENISQKHLAILRENGEECTEMEIQLNFEWLAEKYKKLWFENKEVEDYLRERLPEITFFSPVEFEWLVQGVLWFIEDRYYGTTPATNDGGIDLFHQESVSSDFSLDLIYKTVVQCKLYRGYVPVNEIRDFFGVMTSKVATGIFITTGKFTNQANIFIPEANNSPHSNKLYCLDKQQFEKILSVAQDIRSVFQEAVEQEDDLTAGQISEINKLKHMGKKILYAKNEMMFQKSLF